MRNKLRDNSGVTILLGLLLVIVATMVSVTILTAALSAIKRTNETKEATQRSLTMESAGLLIKNEIDGMSCSVVTTTTVDRETTEKTGPDYTMKPENAIFTDEFKKILEEIILRDESGWITPYEGSFSISTNNEKIETAHVSYAVSKDEDEEKSTSSKEEYTATFTLLLKDDAGKETERMYLSAVIMKNIGNPITRTEQRYEADGTGYTVTITTKTDEYSWSVGDFKGISGGAQ